MNNLQTEEEKGRKKGKFHGINLVIGCELIIP
jgi:hypothetical protein